MFTSLLAMSSALLLTIGSEHVTNRNLDNGDHLNERNYGVGINSYFDSSKYVGFGVYKNSINKTSTYGGVGYRHHVARHVDLGVDAYLVSGYDVGKIIPGVMGSLWLGPIKLGVIPHYETSTTYNPTTFILQVEIK